MDRFLKGYAVLTTVGMLIVVIMGAIVTNTGAADGCGTSWPLCYGQFIPNQADSKTWIELSHRAVSAILGMMVVVLAVWSWIRLANVRETKFLAIMSVFFIVLQGLLGAAAVIWQQSSFVLASHFGFSIISFASVFLLAVVIFEQLHYGRAYIPNLSKKYRLFLYGLTLYTYMVVYSGALVRHSGSSSGCGTSWPLCNGEWIPNIATPGGIQFIHRIAAGVAFIGTLWLLVQTVRKYREDKVFYTGTWIAFLLVVAQIAAGASVVMSNLSLVFLLIHAFFITCYFGVICCLFMMALRMKN